jgi:NADH-quinone oxidoreductase subunit F
MLEILDRICEGKGEDGDIDRLVKLGEMIQDASLCGLGQTAPNPVLSTLRHFGHEYVEHIRDKKCRAGVCAALVTAPCESACPAEVDVPGFVSLTGEKRYNEALKLHRERNPLAAICARVCFQACEMKCRRSLMDTPVSIRAVKRFLVDQETEMQVPEVRANARNAARKIAVIGSGPAGLSCAYFLARLGYRPTIFESEQRAGGMLVQTIPSYRLPRDVVAREVKMIESMGVEIRTGTALGRDFSLEQLRGEGYEAVFMAIGAPDGSKLNIPGADANGIDDAMTFLRAYNMTGSAPVGKNVTVIGGGNSAIDAARTALRLGAESVTVVYRRSRDAMPAFVAEIEDAELEGVKLMTLTAPLSVQTDKNGRVTGLECAPMQLGTFDRSGRRRPEKAQADNFVIPTDQILTAIGQTVDLGKMVDVKIAQKYEFVQVDPVSGVSSVPWLFAGGDVVTGPSSVVEAIAAGERAAVGIDALCNGTQGNGTATPFWRELKPLDVQFDPDAEPSSEPREKPNVLPMAQRHCNFNEVELAWTEPTAIRQACRCLRCDYGKR